MNILEMNENIVQPQGEISLTELIVNMEYCIAVH